MPSLVSLIYLPDAGTEPEDILSSALGSVLPDDVQVMQGQPGAAVVYTAHALRPPADESDGGSRGGTDGGIGRHSPRSGNRSPGVNIHLLLADPVGEDSRRLFAHYVWNSSILVAELMGEHSSGRHAALKDAAGEGGQADEAQAEQIRWRARYRQGHMGRHDWSVRGLSVVELGAGTGLASIAARISGAAYVTITDYPNEVILSAIRTNVTRNQFLWTNKSLPGPEYAGGGGGGDKSVAVYGHCWGEASDDMTSGPSGGRFERVIAADCLWMEGQHASLVASIDGLLAHGGQARAWVVAAFHTGRGTVARFFDEVEKVGRLVVEDIWEVDTELAERDWARERPGEGVGERKRWMAVAVIKRPHGQAGAGAVTVR